MKVVERWSVIFLVLFLLHPVLVWADIVGDMVIYDGERGSAPLIGGDWAAGAGGGSWRNDNGFSRPWSAVAAPANATIRALATRGDTKVWAAGDAGLLMHLDGDGLGWLVDASPVSSDLTGLSAVSATDIWAVGKSGVVLHQDGSGWRSLAVGTAADLHGVAALDGSHVWVVGAQGAIHFFDGSQWRDQSLASLPTLRAVYAASADNVWAVGEGGAIAHWDGQAWTLSTTATSADLYGVSGAGSQAWAVGAGGLILAFDGASWLRQASPTTEILYTVNAASGTPLVAGAKGTVAYLEYTQQWLLSPALGAADIYALTNRRSGCLIDATQQAGVGRGGGNGLVLRPGPYGGPAMLLYCGDSQPRDFRPYDVVEFQLRSDDADPGDPSFHVNSTQGSQVVRVLDYIEGGVIDGQWRRVRIPISALATADWSLGNVEYLTWSADSQGRTYHVDEIALRDVTPPVVSLLGPESNQVLRFAVSERYRIDSLRSLANYRLTSSNDAAYAQPLSPVDVGVFTRIRTIDNSGEAVNDYQFFLRFAQPLQNGAAYTVSVANVANGSGMAMVPAQFQFTYDDGSQANVNIKVNQLGYLPQFPKLGQVGGYLGDLGGAAWAVGEHGTILAWNKHSGWLSQASPVSSTLRAIAATREDAAWAVGDGGVILRWDGSRWAAEASPTTADLLALGFGPDNTGWAVGAQGTILRFDGQRWSQQASPTSQTLRGVWVHSCLGGVTACAWAVGNNGTVLQWTAGGWSNFPQSVTTADLYAIGAPTESLMMAVGANGTVIYSIYGGWNVLPGTPATQATLRTIAVAATRATWVGGDQGLLWQGGEYGSTPLVPVSAPATAGLNAIAFVHARQLWAVGDGGTLLAGSDAGWRREDLATTAALHGVFALPAGVLRLPEPPPAVAIQNADTGATVLTVPLTLKHANWYLSGEDVYGFDFSSLTTPGRYRAHVPGLGNSDAFVIGAEALDFAAYTSARALYYQRSGIALEAPWAEQRFSRAASHEYDVNGRRLAAFYHPSNAASPLYNDEPIGAGRDAHGGWFDAGDYNKYMFNAAISLWYLFTAYDIGGPGQFPDGGWNIPESGNGVPDILDEARWEVDWISRTLDSDGGMYFKVTSECWWNDVPESDNRPQYFIGKTTYDTAMAAAILASAARLWQPFDPALAAKYLSQAILAWNFLQAHAANLPAGGFFNPPTICTGGGEGDSSDFEDADNRAWAAAELYRSTGEAAYRHYFEDWVKNGSRRGGVDFSNQAVWAYLRANRGDADPALLLHFRNDIIVVADELVRLTNDSPYQVALRLDVPNWFGWGNFSQSMIYANQLLVAWALTGNETYRSAAAQNVNAPLGANPLSQSFITGLGARYPRDPWQGQSLFDNVAEPLPGFPVPGIITHLNNSRSNNFAAQSDLNNFPPTNETLDPYPILRRYSDIHALIPMSETGISMLSFNVAVLGLLAQPLRGLPDNPAGTPSMLKVTGLTAQSKVHDGTTAATLAGTPALLGVVGSDEVRLAGSAQGTFDNAAIGSAKAVTVAGLSLVGAKADRYRLLPLVLSADITATATLSALSIQGPASLAEGGSAQYSATASYNDNSSRPVTVVFSLAGSAATLVGNQLSAGLVNGNQSVMLTASYSEDGQTRYATRVVAIVDSLASLNINLLPGWNLLGNSTATAIDVPAIFGDASRLSAVWKWNSSCRCWAFYTPQLPPVLLAAYAAQRGYEVLRAVNGGEGFWVNARDNTSVSLAKGTVVKAMDFHNALAPGWHLLAIGETATPAGFNSALGGSEPGALPGVAHLNSLWAWDVVARRWLFFAPALAGQGGNVLADYTQHHGYLDFATSGRLLGPGVGFWVNKR